MTAMSKTRLAINRDTTALIVVDMQRAFLRDEGSLCKMGLDITYLKALVEPVRTIIRACRKAVIPIIFTRLVFRDDYKDAGLYGERFPEAKKIKGVTAGSWEAEVDERIEPQPDDFIVDKSRYSSFYNTNLEVILKGLKVDTVILCGLTTEICVDSTARDAFARDYNVVLVKDALAACDLKRHENMLEIAEYGYATLCTVNNLLCALSDSCLTDD